jgi:phospholipase C
VGRVAAQGESRFTRRRFLATGALAAASLAAPSNGRAAEWLIGRRPRLPSPHRSGLDHIVVLTMENRSFDHLLGWLPKANGRQSGLKYRDRTGTAHPTYPLAPKFDGCGHPDPDHTHAGGLAQYNHGACDGFLRSGSDVYAIGYYRRENLPFFGHAAPAWTVCDAYFSAVLAPTLPNRIFLSAGATDRLDNSDGRSTLPTIWDRLAAARISSRYYTTRALNDTTLNNWGGKYDAIIRPLSGFFDDSQSGKLAHVTYLDPQGSGMDDHPPADLRAGERFLATIYQAVTSSPAWGRTLLIVNFDEWGGFFDHVPPPPARHDKLDRSLRGFRVPCLLISPFARRRYVSHTLFDHASILKLIEWRFDLKPLSGRVTGANNLAVALDFSRRRLPAPSIPVPAPPPRSC